MTDQTVDAGAADSPTKEQPIEYTEAQLDRIAALEEELDWMRAEFADLQELLGRLTTVVEKRVVKPAALEAEVAELRAFVPMLARMARYEAYCGRSFPEQAWDVEESLQCLPLAISDVLHDVLRKNHSGERADPTVCDVEPEFVRPRDEPLPPAAEAILND